LRWPQELRFPEGVWELTASANFLVGECALPAVDMQASIVIEVRLIRTIQVLPPRHRDIMNGNSTRDGRTRPAPTLT
jgi:hypothetical protein